MGVSVKIEFDRDQLAKALQRVGTVVEKKSTMPALGNVLLEAKDKELTLTATDLETTIQSTCAVKVTEEGRICIPAKSLLDIVKELPNRTGTLSRTDNDWMILESGKAHFRVVGMEPNKFPKVLNKEEFKFEQIRVDTLKKGVDKTSFAISTDEMRYNLNGVFVEFKKDGKKPEVRFVATDGHRLAVIDRELSDDETFRSEKGFILPRKGVMELKRLLGGLEQKHIEIALTDSNAVFRMEDIVIFMRLVVGEFPDYSAVIPKGNKKKLKMNRAHFSNSLRRVSLLSEGKSKCVRLGIRQDGVHLVANSPELGEAEEDVVGEFTGGELEIGFNARYLLDVLSVIEGEEVVLELDHETSPGVVRVPEEVGFFGVIMPMRV